MDTNIRRWTDLKKKRFSEEQRAEIDAAVSAELLEMDLRELRKTIGMTQKAMAEAASMDQSEVSRIERRDDYLLSTLQRVVAALGGELEVVARFDDMAVRLRTTAADPSAPRTARR